MRRTITKVSICCLTLLASSFVNSKSLSVDGLWLARSPNFGKNPIAIVKISIINNKACGELVQILPFNGIIMGPRKILSSGPIIMCNYRQLNDKWVDGKIYEQVTAKIYKSELQLDNEGKHLYVTGWSGPFFRTAVWDRMR